MKLFKGFTWLIVAIIQLYAAYIRPDDAIWFLVSALIWFINAGVCFYGAYKNSR